jgi:TPP-dependent pyruvate/acetoin dehydrogenase alpha subunit
MRSGGGPYLLEIMTFRYRPHSMFDAELYRTRAEVEEWKKRDPILLFVGYLKEHGVIDDAGVTAIEKDVDVEIQQAVDFAEAGTWEAVEDLTRFVYSDGRPA